MTVMTFKEYSRITENKDDKILLDFMLENKLITQKDLQENPLVGALFKTALKQSGKGLKFFLWNGMSKQFLGKMGLWFAGTFGTIAALTAFIMITFGISPAEARRIAEAIYYVGITVGAALIALMGRKIALKFINFVNKNRIDKDIKNLEKQKNITKADLDKIQKIAQKYKTKDIANKSELEKFKKKAA